MLFYTMRAPFGARHDQLRASLEVVRAAAIHIGAPACSTVCYVHGARADYQSDAAEPAWRWGLIQAGRQIPCRNGGTRVQPPREAFLLAITVGTGVEPAIIGWRRHHRWERWGWQASCKMEHASHLSGTQSVAAHQRLVRIFDLLARMGVRVTVRDSTGYWQHRDARRLREHQRAGRARINHLAAILGMPGATTDEPDPEHGTSQPLRAHPIFDSPTPLRFDQLPMLVPQLGRAATRITTPTEREVES